MPLAKPTPELMQHHMERRGRFLVLLIAGIGLWAVVVVFLYALGNL